MSNAPGSVETLALAFSESNGQTGSPLEFAKRLVAQLNEAGFEITVASKPEDNVWHPGHKPGCRCATPRSAEHQARSADRFARIVSGGDLSAEIASELGTTIRDAERRRRSTQGYTGNGAADPREAVMHDNGNDHR
jgi:hypothetical protein